MSDLKPGNIKENKKRIKITTVVEVDDDIDSEAFVYCFANLIKNAADLSNNDNDGVKQKIISVTGE